jgi:TRAP-type C4-dicarboxylate transport system permease small subunit
MSNVMYKDTNYTPNHIPANERMQNIAFSILLAAYGAYGVWVNDLYIPGKRSKGIHLHDVPAWIMYAAFICACLVMLSVVVDHYDKRNNETNYKLFANVFKYLGWGFFVLSLIMAIIR